MVCTVFLLAATYGSALMMGFFATWSVAVLPGLDATGAQAAVRVMTSVNQTVLTPAFATVFFGTPLALVLASVASAAEGAWVVTAACTAALFLYGLGVVGVTTTVNVPLNDALSRAHGDDPEAAWLRFATRWRPWNHVRAVSATAAFSLCLVAWHPIALSG
ncbi:anthrone oxygenase family protein [Dietzia psychralcaliphila]|uniref:DUF1772 domain-containing protein n=1 Tax=Dietzia psychralcaliphila TaxID=139021 RepID=A0AAD0JSC1_9ACTN|nr:anthrone oxygenase family protein [Dietzia psychralcaliphila]AWH95672.1 hypothetical protein A6048_09325 [Dietzia psychralcaliphila]PTM88562.1 putative membrane protein [Dietzia psychralcaliphila]